MTLQTMQAKKKVISGLLLNWDSSYFDSLETLDRFLFCYQQTLHKLHGFLVILARSWLGERIKVVVFFFL